MALEDELRAEEVAFMQDLLDRYSEGGGLETILLDHAEFLRIVRKHSPILAALTERKAPVEEPKGIFVPEANGSCGWPPTHNWQNISAGVSLSGWAKGERMHINRCRQCGEVRGPFINNSGDAGF